MTALTDRHPAVQPEPGVRRGVRLRRRRRGARRLGHPDGGQRRRRRGPWRHRTRAAVAGRRAELGRHRARDGARRVPAARPGRLGQRRRPRRSSHRNGRAALSDVHGTWLVAIVSGQLSPTDRIARRIARGVRRRSRSSSGRPRRRWCAAHYSATEAIAGMNAVAGWSGAPRPVSARELLPERALLGDPTAHRRTRRRRHASPRRRRARADRDPGRLSRLGRARSRRARANCSFIQTPSATASNGSLTSPVAIPPCRAMPTFCGSPRRSVG